MRVGVGDAVVTTMVAGADGCRAGWICLRRTLPSGAISVAVYATARAMIMQRPAPCVLAVDVPIGLTEAGRRQCDELARGILGVPRASSVFPAPIRPALRARTRERASQITETTDGRRVGAQAWGIYDRVRAVDAVLRRNANVQLRVHEAHPEVCFWAWNGGRAMQFGKHTVRGRQERLRLVTRGFGRSAFRRVRRQFRVTDVADDDILDAFATLWTAERMARGCATSMPEDAPTDGAGLRMAIVY